MQHVAYVTSVMCSILHTALEGLPRFGPISTEVHDEVLPRGERRGTDEEVSREVWPHWQAAGDYNKALKSGWK